MVGHIDNVAEYVTDWTYVHDAKNKYRSFKYRSIWWALNAMMFQHAEKMSFKFRISRIFHIIITVIYLFIAPSLFYLFSYFCINFCILYCSVISVISPLLLLIVYCTVCGLLY